jgi:hypothetical protein
MGKVKIKRQSIVAEPTTLREVASWKLLKFREGPL